jgi:hypothetical protein
MSYAPLALVEEGVFLQVHQTGPLTVVSFREIEPGPFFDWSDCRRDLIELIEETGCRRLAFDLTDFDSVSSAFLGLLVTPARQGVEVVVYHPSQHLLDMLKRTQLNHLIRVVALNDVTGDGCAALDPDARPAAASADSRGAKPCM